MNNAIFTIKKFCYNKIFLVIKKIRRLVRAKPIVIFYVTNVQHYLIVKSLVESSDSFFIYTTSQEIKKMVNKNKILKKIFYCDGMVHLLTFDKNDISVMPFFFHQISVAWFQLFHGVTDGFNDYTFSKDISRYDLVFCSGVYRYLRFLALGINKKKLRITGFPKYDLIKEQEDHVPNKLKTILIIPTWGARGSLNFLDGILLEKLSRKYRVVMGIHQVNRCHEWRKVLKKIHKLVILNDDQFLVELSQADLLISDVSSAAFEFLYFDKPIILIDVPWNDFFKTDPMNASTIELNVRESIAFTISAFRLRDDLEDLIAYAMRHAKHHSRERKKIKAFLLSNQKISPSYLVKKEILNFLQKKLSTSYDSLL